MGDTATVADLQVPDGIEVLDDPETVLCSVLSPRKAEAALEEVEEAAAAIEQAEPEVVGKPEKEEGAAE